MEKHARMRYPETSCFETPRQRSTRLALQSSVEREAEHALQFGARPTPAPEAPVAVVSARGITMPFATFRCADYGQLCQFLGLSPSRPRASAQG